MRLVAEQLAAEYDVEPGDAYADQVSTDRDTGRAGSTRASATAWSPSSWRAPYVEGVQTAVGAQLLEDGGLDRARSILLARGQAGLR